jgi:hypothetical protein
VSKDELVEAVLRVRDASPTKVREILETVVAFSEIDEATGQVGGARNDKKSWLESDKKGWVRGNRNRTWNCTEDMYSVTGHSETSEKGRMYSQF